MSVVYDKILGKIRDGKSSGGGGGGAVDSVNGKTGVVVLDADDVGAISVDGVELATLTSGSIAEPGKIYSYSPSADTTFTFPTPVADRANEFGLVITMPDPAVTVAWPSGLVWKFATPALTAGTTASLKFSWNGSNWEGWSVPDMSEYLLKTGGVISDMVLTDSNGTAVLVVHDGTTRQGVSGLLIQQGIGNSTILITKDYSRIRNSTLTLSAGGSLELVSTGNLLKYNNHLQNTAGGLCILDENGSLSIPGSLTYAGKDIVPVTTDANNEVIVAPQADKSYTHTLVADDEIVIDTTALTSSIKVPFEVVLTQPSTAVTAVLPSNIMWGVKNNFSADNPAPDITTGNVVYGLVFCWDGTRLLGNLSYIIRLS